MKPIGQIVKERPMVGWVLFFLTVIVVFLLGLLASSIVERRAEALVAYTPQVEYGQFEPRNEIWGKNFPREYASYKMTKQSDTRTKYNGNAMIDMLDEDPELVVLWAGYGFSKEYNQARGHNNAIGDLRNILRTGAPMNGVKSPMPTTCWTCKGPDVPRLMNEVGVAEFYTGPWERWGAEIVNPIGCGDCHDAKTMNLRISRPALVEAFERMGKDITQASYQEMRTLVCAQCHVEYYFNKETVKGAQYLTFPWDNGLTVEDAEKYYDDLKFKDWTHALSKTPMLKAQHPGYETFMLGTHASRGVTCADCHMPYISEGGAKFTSHHIQSPLANINASCQNCHREETERLVKDVYDRQDAIIQNRDRLEELLVMAHIEAKKAWDLGATQDEMTAIQMDIRHAQWRWDYAAAAHGASFHAPTEIGRIIGTGLDIVSDGRLKLARLLAKKGFIEEIPYPDLSSKAKAQEFLGMPMDKLNNNKKKFLEEIVPQWDKEAEAREAKYSLKEMN